WDAHPAGLYRGPPEIARRLVAVGDRVYVTLGTQAPVTALDAATGQTVRTYAGTEGTGEILYHEGRLFLVAAGPVARPDRMLEPIVPPGSSITVLDAATGQLLWRKADAKALSGTLAVHSGRVFYVAPRTVVCLDAKTGELIWRAEYPAPQKRFVWRAPTLVVSDGAVLCADRRPTPPSNVDEATGQRLPQWLANAAAPCDLTAYSAETGKRLWSALAAESYYTPPDIFVHNGLVWIGQTRARQGPDYTVARDLITGEIKHRIHPDKAFQTTMPHHRCHRDRATARYLITGRTGIEFIDFETGAAFRHHWVRGVCRFGVLPCNGLVYAPPHSCACFIEAKLTGFNALAPASPTRKLPDVIPEKDRLRRGLTSLRTAEPARQSAPLDPQPSVDWPTYRHDAARTGATKSQVPTRLMRLWQRELRGRLSSPVIAQGQLIVASIDGHTVHAFDAQTGTVGWQFTAGGRIDSPPTIADGLVVFGSADGWVYCLRASDGKLVWRFRAAPVDRRLVAFNQLESVWPVHGSVLVRNGSVYCAAGRSSYLDDGIFLVRLDLKTGRKLAERRLYSRDPKTGEQPDEPIMFEMPGILPDVLSSDGDLVYMRRHGFDPVSLEPRPAKRHLYSPAGFLNDDWWHRNYWVFGEHFYSGYIGWRFAGREAPAGRLLVLDKAAIYGFAREPSRPRGAGVHPYQLFAVDRNTLPETGPPDYTRASRDYNPRNPNRKFLLKFRWTTKVPLIARAMVLAGDRLVVVGLPEDASRSMSAFEGKSGGRLCVVSAADGTILNSYRLDSPPRLDAMAVANGRLYLTTQHGELLCLGDGQSLPDAEGLPPLPAQ
ncbi:MAG: PQQ-binding-like beta-propeller repeat protein, partial [Planctomycetes bacterium]|nr:PQQ-binding-like beta-propeller repeat protein [Planctomycetota bacterium]